jgi:hypothetical protein
MLRTKNNNQFIIESAFPEAEIRTALKYINKMVKEQFGKDVELANIDKVTEAFKTSCACASFLEYSWEFNESGQKKYKNYIDSFDIASTESNSYTPLIELVYQPGDDKLKVWMPHVTEYGSFDIDIEDACDMKRVLISAFHYSCDSWNLNDFVNWINKKDSGLDEHLRTSFINTKAANKLADELEKRKVEFIEMQRRWDEINEEINKLEDSKNDLAINLETKLKGWVKLIKEQQDATK